MHRTGLAAFVLFVAVPLAHAGLGESFDERLSTEAFYDCSSTPSYLRVRVVDAVEDDTFEKEVFIGSKSDCVPQAEELRRFRGSFKLPGTAAICAGTPVRLHRFVVHPAVVVWSHAYKPGKVTTVQPEVYSTLAECRAYAKRLNGN